MRVSVTVTVATAALAPAVLDVLLEE